MTVRFATRTAVGLGVLLAWGVAPAQAVPPAPAAAAAPSVVTGLPTAATVGVPDGTSLTSMAGGVVDTGSTTIANKVISGDVRFTGSNLTLRNVRVTGHAAFAGDNIVIEDSEFGSWALSGTAGVRAARIDVFGNAGEDGLHITSGSGTVSDVVVTDSVIHSPKVTPDAHYDGIQVRGVDGLTFERVSVDLGAYKSQYNAALFFENVSTGNKNITVKDSSFLGGGYVYYNGASNVSVTGTVFGEGKWGNLYPSSKGFATFANNVSPDGYVLAYTGGDIVETSKRGMAPAPAPAPTPTPAPAPAPAPAPTPPAPAPTPSDADAPSASTTGTVAGASLAPMAGGYIRTSATTIANAVITGDATFVGDDLTLQNVRVTGTVVLRGDNVRVEDSEFGAVVLSGTARASLTRVEVFGRSGRDGIQITSRTHQVSDVVIEDSWIHSPAATPRMSYEGIQVRGVDGLTIDNVLVDLGAHQPEHTAALRLHSENGGSRDVTVTRSWLLGGKHVLVTAGTSVQVVDSVLGNPHVAYLKPSSAPLSSFTGNITPSGTALRYTGTAIV